VYYNLQRPHRTLHMETPVPTARAPTGRIVSRPVLKSSGICLIVIGDT
jgi:hypothetical protein